MVNLNHGILRRSLLPIPPLAEQHCIVAKVDELMTLCDQLETEIVATEADSLYFLEAVLDKPWELPPTERADKKSDSTKRGAKRQEIGMALRCQHSPLRTFIL